MDKKYEAGLRDVSETMLITIWSRAQELKQPEPIIEDFAAARIIEKIDYDFSKFTNAWASQVGVCVRSMLLDKAVCGFFRANPKAVVVNLGAGLDTRCERLEKECFSMWYDLDVPEGIEFRKKFIQESDRNLFVSSSVFDFAWMDEIKVNQRPVLFIAEGLFMYFEEDRVKELFRNVARRFPGSSILFDILPSILVGKGRHHDSVKKMSGKADFKWGLDQSEALELWLPGIRVVNEWDYLDYCRNRWRYMRWLGLIPWFRRKFRNRIVQVNF